MLRNEESSLQERVQDLERQVSEQRDEITCLKSTLSDVLRRLTLVDGSNQKSVPVTPSYSHNKPGSMIPSKKGNIITDSTHFIPTSLHNTHKK